MAFVDAFEAVMLVKTALPSAGRYGIMLACWQGEPKERPTFPALVQILGDLLQDNSLPVSSAGEIMSPTFFCSFSFLFLFPSGWEGLHPPEPLTELWRRWFLSSLFAPAIWGRTETRLQHYAHKVQESNPLLSTRPHKTIWMIQQIVIVGFIKLSLFVMNIMHHKYNI